MKIEIVNRETSKPSTPTPINLRRFKLSVVDQLAPPIYTQLCFSTHQQKQKQQRSLRNLCLKTHFYPLAWRIKDNNNFMECNDEGAVYFEAQVHGVLLSDFLQNPNAGGVSQLIPIEMYSPESVTGPLLVVQVSFFHCGGLTIGVCMSHKLGDASTLMTFISA